MAWSRYAKGPMQSLDFSIIWYGFQNIEDACSKARWQSGFRDIMEWEEDRYLGFLKGVPYRRDYLVSREELAASTEQGQKLIKDLIKTKQREKQKENVTTHPLEITKKPEPVE